MFKVKLALFTRVIPIKSFLIGVCIMLSTPFLAQQPASFLLGENQFRGIQVYDLIQDQASNYWIATNEGVFHFNGVVYEKIECAKAKSNSAFNFVMDKKGNIYCHNLNNQVFKISNKKLELFYELTEQEGSADMCLSIDYNNNLLISSRQVLVLNSAGKIINRKQIKNFYIGPPFTSPFGSIYYHLKGSDSVLVYDQGKFHFEHLHYKGKKTAIGVLRFYKSNKHYFAVDLGNKIHYSLDPKSLLLTQLDKNSIFSRSESVRVYETSQGIWVASTLPGVHVIQDNGTCTEHTYFENYFISDVYEDKDGNTLLGTFDKGILVIPDIKIPDVLFSFQEDPIVSLHTSNLKTLFIGTSKGKIYTYEQSILTNIHDTGKRPIEMIGSSKSGKWLVFDDGRIRALNRTTGKQVDLIEASLKDIVFISEHQFYIGTNIGVFLGEIHNEKFSIIPVPDVHCRIHYMDYDSIHKRLYLSSALGMMVLPNHGRLQSLQFNHQDIYPNNILVHDGLAYLALKDGEIALFEGTKLKGNFYLKVKDKHTSIKKIMLYRNTILANTSDGFLQFDLKGNLLRSISSIYGLSNKRVVDFTVKNDQIWVAHSGGLQRINPNYNINKKRALTVRIDKVLVNDVYIKTKTDIQLSSNQRKIQFYFSSPTLNNRETIVYQYRLLGYDTTWSNLDFDARQVTYNALSSGSYTFQLRCKNNSTFSKVSSFHFTIATPLYARLWFILVVIVFFIGSVFYIYSYQLRKQRKKAEQINELNASKLTAIQSQMNPHFIFNSLNSIQDLILKKDVKNSYSYITTFSNLVRRTLSYSQKDFIDFEQEIKLLELYLSLEKLRFKSNFEYQIKTNDIVEISIPPLLIQPFIENSLVHGLLHKDGDKKLRVDFVLEETALLCIVTDNGVGREEAKAIRIRQKGDHESFSSQAIQRRFEILSNLFGREYGFEYTDLMDGNLVAGTQVILKIPYKHKF